MLSNNGGSSSILLENVDDYLAPSQACINPLFQPQEGEEAAAAAEEDKPKEPKPSVVVPHRKRRVRRINRNIAAGDDEDDNENTSSAPKIPSPPKPPVDSVKASIADCLACSGCVTTAETVLLEQKHSLSSLRQRLEEKRGQPRAITLSPNAWADLCRYWNLPVSPSSASTTTPTETDGLYRKFTTLLHQMLQANMVIDGNLPLQWTWSDEAKEFVELYQRTTTQYSNNNKNKNGQYEYAKPKTPSPTTALDADRTIHYLPNGTTETRNNSSNSKESSSSPNIPLISGSCPALVCLVEKSLQHLVPYLSQAPSPMSRVGTHLKQQQPQPQILQYESSFSSSQAAQSWDHWAVMPCHDKKLEASRPDFLLNTTPSGISSSGSNSDSNSGSGSSSQQQAVDLVITTQELIELVQEWREQQRASTIGTDTEEPMITMAAYLESLPAAEQRVICEPNELPLLLSSDSIAKQPVLMTTTTKKTDGEEEAAAKMQNNKHKQMAYSSGGHADFIFQYAAKSLFGCSLETVEWQPASSGPANTANGVVIKSARLARQQKKAQHFYQAQLFRHDDGGGEKGKYYSQTPPKTNSKNGESPPPPVLSFGIAHGMQTMQRALKQLDAGSSSSATTPTPMFHYLEAMACPYGCVNGGGAARTVTDASRETPTETRTRVQGTLTRLKVPSSVAAEPPLEDVVPKTSIQRTRYHVVPPMQYAMGAAAGVKVQDIQW